MFGDGDEVGAIEDCFDTLDTHEADGKRGGEGGAGIEEFGGARFAHYGYSRDEFKSVVVWGRFGLDEHGSGCEGVSLNHCM